MNPAKINSTMAAFAKENQRMEMAQGEVGCAGGRRVCKHWETTPPRPSSARQRYCFVLDGLK